MALSGLHKISFFDDNDDGSKFSGGDTPTAGTVVQCNDISENDGDITVNAPIEDNRTPDDQIVYSGDRSELELAVYDDSVLAQLKAWDKADRRIQCVGAGFGKNLQWYEPVIPSVLGRNFFPAGGRTITRVKLQKVGGEHKIYQKTNLLAYLGWEDADSDGVVDNYTTSPTTNTNFNNVSFNYEISDTATQKVEVDIVFPISGIALTQSINVSIDSGRTDRQAVFTRPFGGGTLSSGQQTFSTTGVNSFVYNLPSSVYSINAEIYVISTGSGTASMRFPALTTNGTLTPGDKFLND
jgi:hypothetical protein